MENVLPVYLNLLDQYIADNDRNVALEALRCLAQHSRAARLLLEDIEWAKANPDDEAGQHLLAAVEAQPAVALL